MKVVINVCFGGFGLSPEALLRLYELGYRGNTYEIDKYYANSKERMVEDLKEWRAYKNGETTKPSMFMTVFSPDEKLVLTSSCHEIERHNPLLVQVVEEMGQGAGSSCSHLTIITIPDDVQYEIEEYDGNEHIAERHRTWR